MSEGNGNGHSPKVLDFENGAGDAPSSDFASRWPIPKLSPEVDAMVKQAVDRAIEEGKELEKHEAGSSYGRMCKPLRAGPQKYRDPDIWGPDYVFLGLESGIAYTDEQIAEMKKEPLAKDDRYQRASRLRDAVDTQLGLADAR